MHFDEDDAGAASVGIGSMIVFVAMMMVVAVSSAAILQLFETVFVDNDNSGHRSNSNSGGKIVIDHIYIYRYQPCWMSHSTNPDCPNNWGHHQLTIYFHLFGTDREVAPVDVSWVVVCSETDVVVNPVESGTFERYGAANRAHGVPANPIPLELGHAVYMDNMLGDAASGAAADPLVGEESYVVLIDMYDNQNNFGNDNTGCRITDQYDTNLFITVKGGGTTHTVLNFKSNLVGTQVL